MRSNPFFLAKLILVRLNLIPPETSEAEAGRVFCATYGAMKNLNSDIETEFYRLEDDAKKTATPSR